MKLVHVFDAYCGWSHGFSATLLAITDNRVTPLVRGYATADQVEERLAALHLPC